MKKGTLGLINVGQSPRIDNVSFVTNWFAAQGVAVDVIERGILDGLTYGQLKAMEGPPYDPAQPLYSPDTRSGGFVKAPGQQDPNLGDGWTEVWLPQAENLPRIQACIERLEADGADVLLLCCGKKYPVHAFSSKVPVVFPWKLTHGYVKALADTMERPRVGVTIGLGRTYARDMALWTDNDWARNVAFHFGVAQGDAEIDRKAKGNLDLLVVQAYHCMDYRGGKLGPQENYETRLEKEFGCPVISSSAAALLFTRGLLRPAINEKSFYLPLKQA